MAHKEKMTFHTVPLHFEAELPHGPELRRPQGYYNAARQMCLEMLQKRELPLSARLMRLCSALRALTPQVSSCPPEDGERRIRYFLLSDAPPATVRRGLTAPYPMPVRCRASWGKTASAFLPIPPQPNRRCR